MKYLAMLVSLMLLGGDGVTLTQEPSMLRQGRLLPQPAAQDITFLICLGDAALERCKEQQSGEQTEILKTDGVPWSPDSVAEVTGLSHRCEGESGLGDCPEHVAPLEDGPPEEEDGPVDPYAEGGGGEALRPGQLFSN